MRKRNYIIFFATLLAICIMAIVGSSIQTIDQQVKATAAIKTTEFSTIYVSYTDGLTEMDINWVIMRFIGYSGCIIGACMAVWYITGHLQDYYKKKKLRAFLNKGFGLPFIFPPDLHADKITTGTMHADQIDVLDMSPSKDEPWISANPKLWNSDGTRKPPKEEK